MDKLIYTAMTGASQVMKQQATVSENLANVNSPGFRAALQSFRAVPALGDGLATRTYVVDSTVGADFAVGALQQTERPLDLALPGEGWFVVKDADGKEAFTRNGSFTINTNGILQTRSGLNVVGEGGGEIAVPPDTEITIARDGTVSAVPSGGNMTSIVTIGRLKLVNPLAEMLVRGEDGLFRNSDGAEAQSSEGVQVVSGMLESSNVNMAETLVNMISLARKFDLQMKMIQTADNDAQKATQLLSAS